MKGFAVALGALVCASASSAMAQETIVVQEQPPVYVQQPGFDERAPSYMRAPVAAPRNAFEIGVNTGYTQGFGGLAPGENVQDLLNAGIGFGLNLGYRATPTLGIVWSGQYQEFNPDRQLAAGADDVRGLATSVEAQFHLAPYQRIDPWVSAGVGYRMLWRVTAQDGNNELTHGFQLGKLNAGLDIRVSDSVALGPMIGADLNLFLWRNPEGPGGNEQLDSARVNTFIYGGLQGRFNIGGTRETQFQAVGQR